MDTRKVLLEKGCLAFSEIIEGFASQYAKELPIRSESEANRVGKESLGKIISYMDLSSEEIVERFTSLYSEVVESILNWDKEKTFTTINEIKNYHQVAGYRAEGKSKETLKMIYEMMDEDFLEGTY
jgi:hypothetical protein